MYYKSNEILALDFTVLVLGYEHVLFMTDVFSKYTLPFPTRDQQAESVTQVLGKVMFMSGS